MKKRLLLALMSLALLGTLGGCQSVANEEAADIDGEAVTEETVEESGPVQLTVWAEEDNFTMLEGMIESFKAKYAGEAEFEFTLAVQMTQVLEMCCWVMRMQVLTYFISLMTSLTV